jgi:hypothetical protein
VGIDRADGWEGLPDPLPSPGLARLRRAALVVLLLLVGFAAGQLTARFAAWFHQVALVSLSPDDKWQVRLIDHNPWFDRNFQLELVDLSDDSVATIFDSPDEDRPIGSERIVWSPDSSRFVLIGRHFADCPETARLPTGEIAYLLYDLKSRALRCNSRSQTLPPFKVEELDWLPGAGGPAVWKK